MSSWFCFYLKEGVDAIFARYELEGIGVQEIVVIEDPGVKQVKILGKMLNPDELPLFNFLAQVEPLEHQDINWQEQWETFAPDYQGERLIYHLSDFASVSEDHEIELAPGPGFGDLSHPSTRLTLQMMVPNCQGRIFIDVGCGSGVLGITAMKAGAKRVFAIDIDSSALKHSRNNARLNGLEEDVFFGVSLPEDIEIGKYPIVAMNMISSEQRAAWEAIKDVQCHQMDIYTSGVLDMEKEAYLEECADRGWELQTDLELDGWCAFHFTHQKKNFLQ